MPTLVIATRELNGVAVALAWCVRFAGQIISSIVKSADELVASKVHFSVRLNPRAMPSAKGEKICFGSEQEADSDHGQVFGQYLLLASKKALMSSS